MPKVSVQKIAEIGKGDKNNGWSDFESWANDHYFMSDNSGKKERKTPKAPKMPKLKK